MLPEPPSRPELQTDNNPMLIEGKYQPMSLHRESSAFSRIPFPRQAFTPPACVEGDVGKISKQNRLHLRNRQGVIHTVSIVPGAL